MALSRRSRIRTSAIAVGSTLAAFGCAVGMLLVMRMPTSTALASAAVIALLHAAYVALPEVPRATPPFAGIEAAAVAAFAIRFHRLLGEGRSPAEAARGTRIWMRTATNRLVQDERGPAFGPDGERNPARLAHWEEKQPFADHSRWAPSA